MTTLRVKDESCREIGDAVALNKKKQGRHQRHEDGSMNVLEAIDDAVEAAASRMLQQTFRLLSGDEMKDSAAGSARNESSEDYAEDRDTSFVNEKKSSNVSSSSFFGVISGVGKFVEDFAVTLDNAIGNAIDDWSAPEEKNIVGFSESKEPSRNRRHRASVSQHSPLKKNIIEKNCVEWEPFDDSGYSNSNDDDGLEMVTKKDSWRIASGTSVNSGRTMTQQEAKQWKRRAQIMQKELLSLRQQKEEWKKVQAEYENLKKSMKNNEKSDDCYNIGTSSNGRHFENIKHVDNIHHDSEHEEIRQADGEKTPMQHGENSQDIDQVTSQLEILLSEKARLAQENSRLQRENASLSELLDLATAVATADPEIYGPISDEDVSLYESDQAADVCASETASEDDLRAHNECEPNAAHVLLAQ